MERYEGLRYNKKNSQKILSSLKKNTDKYYHDENIYLKNLMISNFNLNEWLKSFKNAQIVKHRFLCVIFGITKVKSGNSYYLEKLRNSFSKEKKNILFSFQHLVAADPVLAIWLSNEPESILKIFQNACKSFFSDIFSIDAKKIYEFNIKISNFPLSSDFSIIKRSRINSLIKIRGVIISKSEICPNISFFKLVCLSCSEIQKNIYSNLIVYKKIFAICFNCKSKGPFTVYWCKNLNKNFQKIWLQELPSEKNFDRIPTSIEVIVKNSLISQVEIGEEIVLTGIIKYTINTSIPSGFSLPLFSIFIEANNIEKIKKKSNILNLINSEEIALLKLSRKKDLLHSFIKFFCPKIYGQYYSKLSLILGLFSNFKHRQNSEIKKRKNVNILITGSPKTGKTSLLKFFNQLQLNSFYISGEGVTSRGLASLKPRNSDLKKEIFYNGILNLTNKGFCLIDGFEKIGSDEKKLIGSLFEKKIFFDTEPGDPGHMIHDSSLILSFAPKKGIYEKNLSLLENLEIEESFFGTVDIFCVLEENFDIDEKIGISILNSNTNHYKKKIATQFGLFSKSNKKKRDFSLFKKLYNLALFNYNPKIIDVNNELVSNIYVSLRKECSFEGGIKISLKNLDSIFLLTEASARARLRSFVIQEDFFISILTFMNSFLNIQPFCVLKTLKIKYRFLIDYLFKNIAENNPKLVEFLKKNSHF
jgi:DNA replication licensing factor MCM2